MEIKLDFLSDFAWHLRRLLKANNGPVVPQKATPSETITGFFNWQLRRVSKTPRRVHFAAGFEVNGNLRPAFDRLVLAVEAGEDLTPWLSDKIKRFHFRDELLNDWGIHHLHLGAPRANPNKFVKRTGPLLFVGFTDADAYFVGSFGHDDFEKVEVIDTLYRNWPGLLEHWIAKNVVGLGRVVKHQDGTETVEEPPPRTAADVAMLRKARVTAAMKMHDGKVLFPPGGGLIGKFGDSMLVVYHSLGVQRELEQLEQTAKLWVENESLIVGTPKFRKVALVMEDSHFNFYEQNAKVMVRVSLSEESSPRLAGFLAHLVYQ